MMKSFLVFFVLTLISSEVLKVDAFLASSPSSSIRTPIHTTSSSQLHFFAGFEMGAMDAVNEEKKTNLTPAAQADESTQEALFLAGIMTKAIIIFIIKMAKDIVNYPPNLLDQYNRNQQMKNQEINIAMSTASASATSECNMEDAASEEEEAEECSLAMASASAEVTPAEMPLPLELTKTNPFILLAKFLGVLTYKTMHDAIYYPALWIHNYLYPPRNDDNDYYYYY